MTRGDADPTEACEAFWRNGYHVFEGLASPSQVALMARGMEVAESRGDLLDQTYSSASDAVGAYGPVPGEMLLRHCRSRVEAVLGRELIENYSYWRRYNRGSVLRPHKDRTGCEITVTVTIDTPGGGKSWPIWLVDLEGSTRAIDLPPGAGLAMLGSQLLHWREPLAAAWQKQLFLHYVVKDGEFADYAHDKSGTNPLIRTAV
ncbi:hypothetical protein AAG612_07755 [Citromicrobium bathyomarinum]|uniref:hypothetical protein n=1 Tax=Citromicrobium bathyomarinum TaxID=72174 RepID=UPI00315A45C4